MEEKIHQSIKTIAEEANGEKVLDILYMSAYFAPAKSMHLDMFLGLFDNNEVNLDAAIQLLQKEFLIESYNKQAFLVKKIVQNETRTFLKQYDKEEYVLSEAVRLMFFHLLKDQIHPNYVDHALYLLTFVRELDELTEISANLPSLIVVALRRQNRLEEARDFGKMALEFLEKIVGGSHPATLSLQHNLATILDARGQYAKSVKVLNELHKKDLKFSTVEEEMTNSLILHAKTLCELSKYEEALHLYQIILGERTLDSETALDSAISTAWHDYAILLSDMGRQSEAMAILKNVLSQRKKGLSPDDQYGLSVKRSMASVLQAQGKYIKAMKQLQEVFHESTKLYGEYCLETLRAERDIGTLLLHKGEHKEALEKLEDVEKKFQKVLADSHPDSLCTRANIVGALIHLKKYDRALRIAKDIYEIYKRIFGEVHKETLQAKFNIGNAILHQGKLEKAERILLDVYKGYHAIFGPEHHKTVEMKDTLDMLAVSKNISPERKILHAAAEKGDFNKIVNLIRNGANVNESDSEGRTPLHYAALNGHIEVAKYLLQMGAMFDAQDLRNTTPFQLASDKQMKNLLNSVRNLFKDVKKGIQDNIRDHIEMINAKDKNGYSLLHWAVCNFHTHVVQQLIDAGADTKCISLKGNTPLHVASFKGHKEIAEILLQSVTGNDLSVLINSKTTQGGNAALHIASKNNDIDMVKCLLMYGAIYDIQNKDGRTPARISSDQNIGDLLSVIDEMFTSVRQGNSDAITQLKLMIDDNFSIVTKARNSQGHTLLQVAIKNQYRNIMHGILELLKDKNQVK
ncbi:unnamed protein product [Larinioides sclopetarius]|uniref:Uncharacterized protein n=1 Tax=Larinioides sclopetarius TaxID=280406 RepID=A0AAV2B6X4_9ARAC